MLLDETQYLHSRLAIKMSLTAKLAKNHILQQNAKQATSLIVYHESILDPIYIKILVYYLLFY